MGLLQFVTTVIYKRFLKSLKSFENQEDSEEPLNF